MFGDPVGKLSTHFENYILKKTDFHNEISLAQNEEMARR